ncbi:peptide methionine sulfoxide reductase [Kordia sp. YSTF-M3]|uniref:Peptide methionine sulfoxide reductase n=1 Tax=Kordia aestuariivivens TaxID=2759037 RepID=A0ABR7QAA4_9FLAO|nr:peptide methionine sulfoxide reductase [Kordia aestuariivivens]MBC8755500.1 peptide methionine sulfoxide reductase [Kordia aestuariivivens]
MILIKYIEQLPLGYSEVHYHNKKYGVTKSEFNHGNSYKIFAEELGGNDFISLNYYITSKGELLKPCEMPEQKVIHFLTNLKKQT